MLMKKIIFFIITILFLTGSSFSQVKFTIALGEWGYDSSNILYHKLYVIIQPGQTWRVGSSNIRVDFFTLPQGRLTVHPDTDYVRNALPCINTGGYSKMTTTSINGGVAISLNIVRLTGQCCTLTQGTYLLGKLRFNMLDSCCCNDTVRHLGSGASPLYDSLTLLTPAQWLGSYQLCMEGINHQTQELPKNFKLYNNYPNPFNPTTTIKFDLPKKSYVQMIIYDILGKTVSTLVDENREAGSYEVEWNGSNYSSGTYFYKLSAGDFVDVKRMILLK